MQKLMPQLPEVLVKSHEAKALFALTEKLLIGTVHITTITKCHDYEFSKSFCILAMLIFHF